MNNMEATLQETLNKQSDIIRDLMKKNNELTTKLLNSERNHQQEINRMEREHAEEITFLKTVIIAALDCLPAKRVTLFKDSPKNAEFALEPNISNDMIVILKNII